ncbi:MAG: cupin domain-containing protein [Actinomycetota bacterium]
MTVGVRLVRASERTEGATTPGMIREEAVSTPGMWAGLVRTEPGMTSGWHHHGAFESVIHVTSGVFRMEFGPGGGHVLEALPGDFLYVDRAAIHRESNPGGEECRAVVVRAGHGEPVFNVDGPEPPHGRATY